MTVSASCTSPLPRVTRLDVAGELERDDVVEHDLGAEPLGLLLHLDHELRTLDSLGESGVVFDLGRLHELAARLNGTGDDEGAQVRAGSIDRGRVAGGA